MASNLLDTNIISLPLKRKPHSGALEWLLSTPRDETYLSVITLQETRTGIELLAPGEKREALEVWFARTRRRYAGRILPVTDEVAHAAGRFTAHLRKVKAPADPNDILIAATAYVHGLYVATLNRKDFGPLEALGLTLVGF